jgi:ABC-2 type transport system ATP-binding protein
MTNAVIVTEGLRCEFGDHVAVAGIDLKVEPQEIYGFLGPNGAGKSTTVRMLCTLLRPTAGRAIVAGHDVRSETESVRLRIGVALQEAALDKNQSGRELLTLQGRLYGLRGQRLRRRIREVMDLIDIGDAIERRVGTYSGGMARRLDLAAALIANPQVLFLDEPTTGLDPISRAAVWEEVSRINAELGMTILLTTQYLEEADQLADRVGIIDHGRMVAEGTPDALKRSVGEDAIVVELENVVERPAAAAAIRHVPRTVLADTPGPALRIRAADGASSISPVAVALSHANVRVRSLTLRSVTLDDVFLKLTGDHLQDDSTAERSN